MFLKQFWELRPVMQHDGIWYKFYSLVINKAVFILPANAKCYTNIDVTHLQRKFASTQMRLTVAKLSLQKQPWDVKFNSRSRSQELLNLAITWTCVGLWTERCFHFPDGLKMKETALVFIQTSQWWNVSSSLYTKINEHWEIL